MYSMYSMAALIIAILRNPTLSCQMIFFNFPNFGKKQGQDRLSSVLPSNVYLSHRISCECRRRCPSASLDLDGLFNCRGLRHKELVHFYGLPRFGEDQHVRLLIPQRQVVQVSLKSNIRKNFWLQ